MTEKKKEKMFKKITSLSGNKFFVDISDEAISEFGSFRSGDVVQDKYFTDKTTITVMGVAREREWDGKGANVLWVDNGNGNEAMYCTKKYAKKYLRPLSPLT